MNDEKNKSAVHLGRLSAKKRRNTMTEKQYSEYMKQVRAKRPKKSYPQKHIDI